MEVDTMLLSTRQVLSTQSGDVDGDGIFGEGDASRVDRRPTFWEDSAGAARAATAVMIALGTTDWIGDSLSNGNFYHSDRTFTPYGLHGDGIPLVDGWEDDNQAITWDTIIDSSHVARRITLIKADKVRARPI